MKYLNAKMASRQTRRYKNKAKNYIFITAHVLCIYEDKEFKVMKIASLIDETFLAVTVDD